MCWSRTLLLALFVCCAIVAAENTESKPQNESALIKLGVRGLVRHRYATVQLNTLLENPNDIPVTTNITLHVPETAFVSHAVLEVDGEVIRGQVQDRRVAHEQYQLAASTGAAASQVSAVRDANEIKIEVNVEANSRAVFNLTYEELLVRRKGRYELIINVDPQETLERLEIEVDIQENKNITFVSVPPFSSTLRPDDLDNKVKNHDVKIEFNENENHAKITYLKEKSANESGFRPPGPLAIRYDVARDQQKAGEILLLDGFFVHFMTADKEKSSASALPKHAIFVLDSSASMWGPKLEQLKIAMSQILRQLRKQDVFSIVTFGNKASEWSLPGLQPAAGKGVYAANRRNIAHAMEFINRMQASGGTNIQHALRRALYLSARFRNMTLIAGITEGPNYTTPKPPPERNIQPVVMFLTDGVPTAGEVRLTKLLKSIQFANQNLKASIFALALGPGANYGFLRRMALLNNGFSRRIYESSDTALQLQSFYQEISSPMLTNVSFVYLDQKVNFSSITARNFPTLYFGSEAVVAGKLADSFEDELENLDFGTFSAKGVDGNAIKENITLPESAVQLKKNVTVVLMRRKVGVLEKMWAHLTVRQLLDKYMIEGSESDSDSQEAQDQNRHLSNARERAVALALKYGFVTPLTSLVMVSSKKNTSLIEMNDIEKDIKQSEIEINDKFVSASTLPMAIHQAVLNKPSSTPEPESTTSIFESYGWLSTLLAENDSITFIKPDGKEVTRIVSNEHSEESGAEMTKCNFTAQDKTDHNGFCKHLTACPTDQVPTFNEFVRRYCEFDGIHLGVCCES